MTEFIYKLVKFTWVFQETDHEKFQEQCFEPVQGFIKTNKGDYHVIPKNDFISQKNKGKK